METFDGVEASSCKSRRCIQGSENLGGYGTWNIVIKCLSWDQNFHLMRFNSIAHSLHCIPYGLNFALPNLFVEILISSVSDLTLFEQRTFSDRNKSGWWHTL